MTPGIFVGVDSGGTRTNVHVALCESDQAPTVTSSYEISESLSGALATNLIPITLRRILAPLQTRLPSPISLPGYIWISAAGFTPWTRDDYFVALNELAPSIAGGRIHCVGVANDAVSLLLGSRADAIIIAGTGSSVIVRSRDGQLHQAGGHEWVASDSGSGFWIALRAIREAFRDFENGHESALLQRMRESYDIKPDDKRGVIEKMRDLAVADKDMKKHISGFTIEVCAAAERGDESAQNIVKLEAEELADITAGTLRRQFQRSELADRLRVVQCGSLLGNQFYRTAFEAQIAMRLLVPDHKQAQFDWHRVITAGDATVQLARDLSACADQYLELDQAFRPAVLQL
jgi:N-acetylglucosamine kinase-like BadF-type ATPase